MGGTIDMSNGCQAMRRSGEAHIEKSSTRKSQRELNTRIEDIRTWHFHLRDFQPLSAKTNDIGDRRTLSSVFFFPSRDLFLRNGHKSFRSVRTHTAYVQYLYGSTNSGTYCTVAQARVRNVYRLAGYERCTSTPVSIIYHFGILSVL